MSDNERFLGLTKFQFNGLVSVLLAVLCLATLTVVIQNRVIAVNNRELTREHGALLHRLCVEGETSKTVDRQILKAGIERAQSTIDAPASTPEQVVASRHSIAVWQHAINISLRAHKC